MPTLSKDRHLQVGVEPKACRNDVDVVNGGRLRVRITVPVEGGKANGAVVALLAKSLGVAKGNVVIVRGHRSRAKVVGVEDLSVVEALAGYPDLLVKTRVRLRRL